ncbi:MAG: bifunctional response regulator/alkaline phosphatase family protein [Chlorobi bacterium]|nr:bifunctional response regulator/alkaline phosphatase family protein [Chlorobiota bacterium]
MKDKAYRILWVDDEIDLLKPHLIFLENKGYRVDTCRHATEALDRIRQGNYDVILLDEQMPGIQGLELLGEIKKLDPSLPVVMVTKSEEENIMEEAIGKEISDYIIKPVNPNEIILSLKKIFQKKQLVTEQATRSYQREFGKIAMDISLIDDAYSWAALYKKLSYWSIKMDEIDDEQMLEILDGQIAEANRRFFKFIKDQYADWLHDGSEAPVLSHTLLEKYFLPRAGGKSLLVVIDNFRYDHWLAIRPLLEEISSRPEEQTYYSILPTATQYARNALFAGLMPADIKRHYPSYWKDDNESGGKNLHEEALFNAFLARKKVPLDVKFFKILNPSFAERTAKQIRNLRNRDLIVVVYNFVDMVSHAKTEMDLIKELAPNDKAYRALIRTWFENSTLLDIIRIGADQGRRIFITTDHGSINVKRPTKVIADRETSLNLRYKVGRSLTYDEKHVLACKRPEKFKLPAPYMNSTYIFAKEDYFFVYPNNYNYYVKYFENTYQHGGVSLQEMIVPFVTLD